MKRAWNTLKSTHNLAFEVKPYTGLSTIIMTKEDGWLCFRVGTCKGLWRSTPEAYEILAIKNHEPGNGHFNDVMEWFEHSCRRDNRMLCFREMLNPKFACHLIEKRGFEKEQENLIKKF